MSREEEHADERNFLNWREGGGQDELFPQLKRELRDC